MADAVAAHDHVAGAKRIDGVAVLAGAAGAVGDVLDAVVDTMVPSSPVSQRMIWMPLLPAPMMVLRAMSRPPALRTGWRRRRCRSACCRSPRRRPDAADAVAAAGARSRNRRCAPRGSSPVHEAARVGERALAAIEHQARQGDVIGAGGGHERGPLVSTIWVAPRTPMSCAPAGSFRLPARYRPGAIASGARARAAASMAVCSTRLWSSGLPGCRPKCAASSPSVPSGTGQGPQARRRATAPAAARRPQGRRA